ncbi:Omp28-related outer membrane protein [Psychroserpens sp. SPM9]|uniref:Omp28-related outer membrane protein n=1 Tax=Psychroserpens sp. SPM9 TaxID=2975598 RepID=UPI0021A7ECBE|nr:Omp28-related outer membrane protein [Psychroserpens sp. SPM9]MDG5490094.1 Omp28-related outer membrane protein [Psychroserpens sp. SPM9]
MKIKSLTKIFLFVAVAALFSCSSSDSGDGGDGGSNGPNSISVNASSLFVDFGQSVTFEVTTNEGDNVTSQSTIRVNGTPITGNVYTAANSGSYTITAIYGDLTSQPVTVQVLAVIDAVSITANQSTLNLGSRIKYTVTATDTQGNDTDITSASNIYINDTQSVTGGAYIPDAVGTVSAYATFDTFTTEPVMVTVEDNAGTPATYNRRALIEDYTGDWCGYCTRVAVAIEMVEEASDDVVIVATHVFNGDPYENQYGLQMADNAGVTGLPTAIVNRQEDWVFPETNNVAQVTSKAQGTMTSGISITSASKGSSLSFMVNVGFGETMNGSKLVIFLLENGLVLNQANYYPEYYGGQNPVPNFVHNHVLRHSFTNVLGDAIPASESVANNTYRTKINYNVPAGSVGNPNNLEIVAMLVASDNSIININKAAINTEVVFD